MYDYPDQDGVLRYQVVRYRYDDDGEKTFLLRRPDGTGGWSWNLKGVTRLPYCLPQLLAALQENPDVDVFIPEGEEDVDRIWNEGLVATCNSEGAGKFQPELVPYLDGTRCVLLQDNDEAGERHVQKTGTMLHSVAASLKILDFPTLSKGADVSDWLNAGHTVEELITRAERAPSANTDSFRLSESPMLGGKEGTLSVTIIPSTNIPPPDTDQGAHELLGAFVPGPPAVVLASGETSAGKTVLAYNLAYHMAEGKTFAGLTPPRPLRVLYIDLENPDTVHRHHVHTIGQSPNLAFVRSLDKSLDTAEGRTALTAAGREYRPDVVIIDPLSIAWPVRDENDNAIADRQMWGLKQMAVELHTTVIALWNMGEGNVKEKFRARGATARMDRPDLGLNYTELTETTRQLKVVKSRYGTMGLSLTLRFAGDLGFEAVETADEPSPSRLADLKKRIMERSTAGDRARKQFIALGKEDLVDKALRQLVLAGELIRAERGVYDPAVSSEPPSIGRSDSEETTEPEMEMISWSQPPS